MKMLKFAVISLAVLIALAIGMLAFGLYKKSVDPAWKLFGPAASTQATSQAAPQAAPLTPFGDVSLGLPAACEIVSTFADGGRLIFEIVPLDDCPAAVVIDLATGQRLGSVRPR